MLIGVDSFVETTPDSKTGELISPAERIRDLLEEIELADQVGLGVFGIGEHHRKEFVSSTPAVILAAAAARTHYIRLSSAVTVLSSDDPVRVFQEFATVDLISNGRAEIVAGRGSFIESYPLFGFDVNDYDALFEEKLDLLLKLRESPEVYWAGRFRAPLSGQGVYPRPVQDPLPVWIGAGGTPNSFVRAGRLGLPLVVAIIGGEPRRFRPLVELYREAGRKAGHLRAKLRVGVHSLGFLGENARQAADDFFPAYAYTFSRIGKERGWPPVTRAQFDATSSALGALLIGDTNAVAEKILYEDEVLGGIERFTLLLTPGTIPHGKVMHAIELLGTKVAPIVNKSATSIAVGA